MSSSDSCLPRSARFRGGVAAPSSESVRDLGGLRPHRCVRPGDTRPSGTCLRSEVSLAPRHTVTVHGVRAKRSSVEGLRALTSFAGTRAWSWTNLGLYLGVLARHSAFSCGCTVRGASHACKPYSPACNQAQGPSPTPLTVTSPPPRMVATRQSAPANLPRIRPNEVERSAASARLARQTPRGWCDLAPGHRCGGPSVWVYHGAATATG